MVSDDYGGITSDVATLFVNVKPVFVLNPINQTVVPGGTVGFSAIWTGSAPVTHRWRLGTTNLASINGPDIGYVYFPLTNGYIIGNQTNSFLVLTNISLSTTGRYSISTSNVAGQALSAVASLTLVADTDGDGLPDSWETGRPGFSPNNPADAARDNDGDGMSNLAEYIAGTDYLDPTSYLKVEIVAAGQASLRFNAVSNRIYTVQYSDGLNPALWRALANISAYPNTRPEIVVDANAVTNRFYRLVTPVK